jgi:hypothetical protein
LLVDSSFLHWPIQNELKGGSGQGPLSFFATVQYCPRKEGTIEVNEKPPADANHRP